MPGIIRKDDNSTSDPCGAPPHDPSAHASTVFANAQEVVRLGDAYVPHACPGAAPHGSSASGSSGNVYANGALVHRIGDAISCGSTAQNGSSNVIINAKGSALAAMGWDPVPGVNLPSAAYESFAAADNEERNIYGNPDVDANESGEYGDGALGSNPRGDDNFPGDSSPTTGEEGPLETPDSTPWTGDVRITFLPHTDPGITAETQAALENIASVLDRELTITSAYRAPDYNARVGGKKGSKHMQGIAIDVVQSGWSTAERIEFIETAVAAGFKGIGLYNSFTHIDLRGSKAAWGPTGSRKSLPKQSWAIPTLQSLGFNTG